MKHVVLISKDILSIRYLPIYGNKYWKTPNINELAAKGTVFFRHYTAAPSTAMAFTSMFTGKYPSQTNRANYTEVKEFDIEGGTTLFDEMEKKGYRCHLIWSNNYVYMAERYSKCYGKNTIHHNQLSFNQYVGPHLPKGLNDIKRDDIIAEENYKALLKEIDTINRKEPVFLWIHLPHVMKGRAGYGDDIDLLDRFVGDIRKRFGDYIFITADHGCNDGKDDKTGYGFDLYEASIHIPLITPRLDGQENVFTLTSNVDLMSMILKESIPKRDYILSDTAYYQQPHRKLAILLGNYKFVYEKATKRKRLYDVIEDPLENFDLNNEILYDIDRRRNVITKQVLFYPYHEEAKEAFRKLDEIFKEVWRNGDFLSNQMNKYINQMKNLYGYFEAMKKVRENR